MGIEETLISWQRFIACATKREDKAHFRQRESGFYWPKYKLTKNMEGNQWKQKVFLWKYLQSLQNISWGCSGIRVMAQLTSIHGEVGAEKWHGKHKGIKRNPINGCRTRTIATIPQLSWNVQILRNTQIIETDSEKKLHIMKNIPVV